MTVHVLPSTEAQINALIDKAQRTLNTQGKVIDSRFKATTPPSG